MFNKLHNFDSAVKDISFKFNHAKSELGVKATKLLTSRPNPTVVEYFTVKAADGKTMMDVVGTIMLSHDPQFIKKIYRALKSKIQQPRRQSTLLLLLARQLWISTTSMLQMSSQFLFPMCPLMAPTTM